MLQKAQWAIQRQKDEIIEEKEKFGKDKRAILLGDLKMIDFQGKEVAALIDSMRDELRVAKIVCCSFHIFISHIYIIINLVGNRQVKA